MVKDGLNSIQIGNGWVKVGGQLLAPQTQVGRLNLHSTLSKIVDNKECVGEK